jgi:hypothetical protein
LEPGCHQGLGGGGENSITVPSGFSNVQDPFGYSVRMPSLLVMVIGLGGHASASFAAGGVAVAVVGGRGRHGQRFVVAADAVFAIILSRSGGGMRRAVPAGIDADFIVRVEIHGEHVISEGFCRLGRTAGQKIFYYFVYGSRKRLETELPKQSMLTELTISGTMEVAGVSL